MSRVPVAWRWLLAGVIVVVAAAVALWPRDGGGEQTADRAPAATEIGPELRAASGAAQCPRPVDTVEGHGPLAGLSLGCLADGRPVDPAVALAGRPAVLNLWAYWCEPCRTELPILAEYAARAGSAVAVVTVHSDPGEAKALSMLAALNKQLRAEGAPELRLPGFQDPDARVRAAAGAPNALPITVLVRADGTIADYIARPFHDVDDIASIVADKLGVTV